MNNDHRKKNFAPAEDELIRQQPALASRDWRRSCAPINPHSGTGPPNLAFR
jgi:hypothetical protein